MRGDIKAKGGVRGVSSRLGACTGVEEVMGFGKCGVLPHLRGGKVAQSPMRGVAVSKRHGLDGLAQPIRSPSPGITRQTGQTGHTNGPALMRVIPSLPNAFLSFFNCICPWPAYRPKEHARRTPFCRRKFHGPLETTRNTNGRPRRCPKLSQEYASAGCTTVSNLYKSRSRLSEI